MPAQPLSRRWALGLLFIVLVAVIWAAASVLVQFIYNDLDFDQPFVVTYVCNSLFAVYLPMWAAAVVLGWVPNPPWHGPAPHARDTCWPRGTAEARALTSDMDAPADAAESEAADDATMLPKTWDTDEPTGGTAPRRLSHWATSRVSLLICPLWFTANFAYNQSLSMTSVTSSTIISTVSSLFSFGLSVAFTGEKFSWTKFSGVLLCIAGTVCVALGDSDADDDAGQHSVVGDLVCLFGAVMYSVYTVVLRVHVPDDETVAMPLLFGYLGAFNALLLLPVVLLVLLFNGGVFSGFDGEVFGFVALKGLFDNVLSDYLWARAVVLTTPTVATVGLSLTIPLAFASDAVINGIVPDALSGFGGVLVVGGFLLVNVG